ncbi:restriction endonuclease subunit S [Aeromonas enteropelogenes]|uniref:restriction endonuclease subunit S n=1 Tax=Aeromonas enteropelogenes TaxID=29489 RepID=UPI003F742306
MSEVVVTPQQGLAGKYQPYPEYKVSGVEWIGDVPQSWEATKVKRWLLESPCYGVLKPDKYDGDDAVPLIRIMDVKADGTIAELETLESISPSLSIEYQRTLIRKGDLIVSVVGTLGRSFICDDAHERMNLSRALTRLQVCDLSTAKYLQYVINSKVFEDYVGVTCTGAAQKVLNLEDVSNWFVPSPPLVHRSTIVAFLDYETARIDRLIAQQQRLIELLKEKRQAVISHAVTKGLNPDAPMKDSGVEWLGQVPKHWVVSPLKYKCEFSGGGTPSKDHLEYWNGSIPWVSPKDMKSFWITDAEDKITEQAIKESSTKLVQPGAVLIVVRSGILQRTIPVGINTIPVTMNQDMKAIRFSSAVYAEWLSFFIKGYEDSLLLDWRKQGATVESIEHEYLANSLMLFPPEEEARSIIAALGRRLEKFDQLEQRASDAITLLQECRTALISAAVTGKIDLRSWTPPAEEAAA